MVFRPDELDTPGQPRPTTDQGLGQPNTQLPDSAVGGGNGAPDSASTPSAPDEPIGPGLAGPYFQPGSGSGMDASSVIAQAGGHRLPIPKWDEALSGRLRSSVMDLISGRNKPFTPDVVAALKRNAFAAASGQAQAGVRAANRDALNRGIFRSGVGVGGADRARDRAAQNFSNATAEVDTTAAQQNFAAQMEGIKKGKELLDQLAQRIQSMAALGQDTTRLQADLALGYDRIAAAERQQHNDLNAAMEQTIVRGSLGA